MQVRFWGVRGSIAVPGPNTVRYGGNTTCIEVLTNSGERLILDAGTGIFPLARALASEMPLSAHIFITHTHWDHIQGLPFFTPLFAPGNRVRIYGAFDPVAGRGIDDILSVQMQHRFYPVGENELKADVKSTSLQDGEQVRIGGATITPVVMNHPVINFGYRIEADGQSLFFTGDHEPFGNDHDPSSAAHARRQKQVEELHGRLIEAIRDVDMLIADSAYTEDELASKRGWGHGTHDSSIDLAKAAGIKTLVMTHHEPTRSDDALDELFLKIRKRHGHKLELVMAHEGMVLEP
ncbi:MAG TPA: MBL fold metallo-hydrolase [Mariprofundaceae bacterium]|nr:MBL fold metallo-hydrolase [Mariprofundaceae bacterium]